MKEGQRKNSTTPYALEERTYEFTLATRLFLKVVQWDPVSWSDVKQLIRSSGSVAANYIESIEGLSTDDTLYRLRLSKKEARESGLWLRLLSDCNLLEEDHGDELSRLLDESNQLVRILASIIRKKENQP